MSAAEATHPRWSPDGRTVAFSSTGDLWRLAVRPAGRGLRLTRKCRACLGDDFPAWSPDGRKILFVRDGALFTIRALNGARPRELKMWRPRFFNSPDWAPDGRRIAFQRSGSGIYFAGADGTCVRRVGDQSLRGTHPRWSPDGKRIAFLGWRRGILSVLVVRADGRGRASLRGPTGLIPA